MLQSLYDLSFCILFRAAPEEPTASVVKNSEYSEYLPVALADECIPSLDTESATPGEEMTFEQTMMHRQRRHSSVRFSKTSASLHMPPIEELSECSSAETPTSFSSTTDISSTHANSRSHRKSQSSRLPMSHKSRRRRVHQMLMDDYAQRQQRQALPTASSPSKLSSTSFDDCSLSATSYSDVSSISCDSK